MELFEKSLSTLELPAVLQRLKLGLFIRVGIGLKGDGRGAENNVWLHEDASFSWSTI